MKARKTKPLAERSWNAEKWRNRCAWCGKMISGDAGGFGIEISLRAEVFREFDPGSVQPLLLAAAGRVVPMMIVTDDSPAKRSGKDAMFQLCSEACALSFKTALQAEMGGGAPPQ